MFWAWEKTSKMTKLKTLKEICWKNKIGLKDFIAFQQEAIKWIKEDRELLLHDGETGVGEEIVKDIFINRWMKRLNITEEDLKWQNIKK